LGGAPAGGNLISVCFFFCGRCDALGDARCDACYGLGDALESRQFGFEACRRSTGPIAALSHGRRRDRLGKLDGGRPLALGPLGDPFADDHAEADEGAPDPLDLLEPQPQACGDHPEVDIGKRAAVFFAVASRLK